MSQLNAATSARSGPAVPFAALSLPVLLRRRAEQCPDALAVRDATGRLTYAELTGEVHRLARYLTAIGIGQGDRVACALPRGVPAVVAQAAIFAAGAVYVPVNASYPERLLSRMLAALDVRCVLGLRARRPVDLGPVRIDLDDPAVAADIAAQPASPPGQDPPLDSVAYIMHTSGTSGRPKAVAISHRAASNAMQAYGQRYPDPIEVYALISSLTFDGAIGGVWWTLLSGGTVSMLSPDTATAIDELVSLLSAGDVSHTMVTPSLYRSILPGIGGPAAPLRQIMVAGEPCDRQLVVDHHRRMPGVELLNIYGPTETTVWCSSATLRPDEDVTVGTALANTELLIVGGDGGVVPDGELGEVWVAGPNVGEGYIGAGAADLARFTAHPAAAERRCYRTGDLGRWRDDGRLELHGRIDEQVKVRGFRVEPEGVAAELRGVPGVRDAAVAMRSEQLVAYVVPEWDERSVAAEMQGAWNTLYGELDHSDELVGWTSSYTGERLPEEEMDEWRAATLELAREGGAPRSLLDLGFGTGMMLTRLAPGCDRVVGIDPSPVAARTLRPKLAELGLDRIVDLRTADARETAGLAGFDLVLCNSVAFYFHGAEHLAEVIAGARAAAAPHGRVIMGDLKDLGLQDALHAAVVLARADDDEPVAALRQRWRRRVDLDPYLLMDPRWFTRTLPGCHVEVRPRRGAARNEMNDFRFDVVIAPEPRSHLDIPRWRPWPGGLDAMADLLTGDDPVAVTRVPNRRTAGACAVRARLTGHGGRDTAASLRRLATAAEDAAVHPEELAALAEERGWEVRFSRAAGWPDGEFDVVFTRPGGGAEPAVRWPGGPSDGELINAPIHRQVIATATDRLLPAVRERADDRLPAHERPAAYVALTELPIGAHGKLDHAALPDPPGTRSGLTTDYARPVLPIEQRIARAMSEIMGIDRVGLHDDFLELGGDSLLAVRLTSRLSEWFDLDLPTRAVFDAPTVAQLATLIADHGTGDGRRQGGAAALGADLPRQSGRLPLTPPQAFYREWITKTGSGRGIGPLILLPVRYRIRGPIDRAVLAAAVDQTAAWHPALRTAVRLHGRPREAHQFVHPPATGTLRMLDADGTDPDAVLQEFHAGRPLDLAAGNVFSAELVRVSEHDHLLSLRLHNLVGDASSLGILEEEIGHRYRALRAGREPACIPRSDYARLSTPLSAAPRTQDVHYWDQKLTGCGPIELIPGGGIHHTAGHHTRVQSLMVPAGPSRSFQRLARARSVTFAGAVYAVFCAIMAADTGDPDTRMLAVNSVRPDSLAHTVGGVADTVLLRHRLRPDASVAESLTAAHRELHQALGHDSVSLLSSRTCPPALERLLARSQIIYLDVLPPTPGLRLEGCSVERFDQLDEDFPGPFDIAAHLGFLVRPEGEQIRLAVAYDTSFAPASYVRGLLERTRDIITACARPGSPPLAVLAEPDGWLAGLREKSGTRPRR
ncbi:amino acid adenylation domain-containing protein [Spirillospora sp. NPDC029432]|uniref:amino acid adenylation domain-containing protein n=1 Tax=Spirillospora sp. NPDC029432 TaxID=3154599 RepID=UPI00345293D7